MMSYLALHVFLIACAIGGFLLAAFIHSKKKRRVPLVCPIGHSCDPVVHSDYSRFMHIPVEILGAAYYVIVVVAYVAMFTVPALHSSVLGALFLGLSATAVFFSLYLTAVQAFILREWCTWCLISAALCAAIFLVGLKLAGVGFFKIILIDLIGLT